MFTRSLTALGAAIRDETLSVQIRIWQGNYEVYGARKIRRQMLRERAPVERLMRNMELRGVTQDKAVKPQKLVLVL